jgi:hypothetical protein
VTIQEPTQVTSCCNLLAPVRQLSSKSRSARMSFSQVQPVFIVEHYLASRSHLTCQNEFRDTFPGSPVPNKSTISRLVNRFRETGSVQDRNRSDRPSVLSDDSLDDIRWTFLRSPRKSLRKLSLQSELSYGSVLKATKILKLHPYRQCRCRASSLVVALFLETCGPLDHRISIFGGSWRRTYAKTTRTHEKNWKKILSCEFQTSLQKLFAGLHQIWKDWMHASLNAVGISNT